MNTTTKKQNKKLAINKKVIKNFSKTKSFDSTFTSNATSLTISSTNF